MIRAALTLARKGLHVFPCRPLVPRPATANGLKDATTDLDLIRQWWRQEQRYNVAVTTGERSGIFVIDIDGLDAECELRKLEACLLYTSDAADALTRVDLGGRRLIT